MNYLNKIRIKNKLNISENIYNNLGEILKQNISGIDKENNIDFESYKLIIIISTSLYKYNFSKKIFLQNFINDCPIWKKNEFWEKMIQYEIIEEMTKQKKLNLLNISKENIESKIKKIQLIAKSYLNTYIYHMISFNISINVINEIISFFSNYYFFEKNTIDFLNNILKNYKKEEIEISQEENSLKEINELIEIKKELLQKQPLDNISKSKQRRLDKIKSEELNSNMNINNLIEKDNFENLNINLINKDNNKKINDEYKEEDIKSQIALTENSYDKNDILDLSIKKKSKLKIVNEGEN